MILSERLKELRTRLELPQRKVAAALDIDTATYSKIENGLYSPRREQILLLATILQENESELIKLWLADKVYGVIKDENNAIEALKVVKEVITEYGRKETN